MGNPESRRVPYTIDHDQERAGLRDYRASVEDSHVPGSRASRGHMWLFLIVLVAVFVLGFTTGQAFGAEKTCIRSFEVRPMVMLPKQHYDVEVRIRLEQHEDHRAYYIGYYSDETNRSGGALVEINNVEGELSPVTQDPRWFKGLPGGRYVFGLALYGRSGKVLAQRTVETRSIEPGADR